MNGKKVVPTNRLSNQSKKLTTLVQNCALNPEQILDALEPYLKSYPYSAEGWFLRAQMLNSLGKRKEALASLKKVEYLHSWHSGLQFERSESALLALDDEMAAKYLFDGIDSTLKLLVSHLRNISRDESASSNKLSDLVGRLLSLHFRGAVDPKVNKKLLHVLRTWCAQEVKYNSELFGGQRRIDSNKKILKGTRVSRTLTAKGKMTRNAKR